MSTLFGFKNETKPKIPQNFNRTQRKLCRMFTETVDCNILDSGSMYGWRNDRNRKDPPWYKPEYYNRYSIVNEKLEVSPSCGVYWFLENNLYYDKKLDSAFQKWRCNQGWALDLDRLSHFKFAGDLSCEWVEGATYMNDPIFDQDFVYYTLSYDYDRNAFSEIKYAFNGIPVIIMLHGGCDIRVGYTQPTMFLTDEYADSFNDIPYPYTVTSCLECGSEWISDSVYSDWESSSYDSSLTSYPCGIGTEGKAGTVVVTEDGKAFCPVCGKALLN